MCDFNEEIFQSDFDLPGAHLVEASAGTGKTYNIQNIYARLIMETDFRVSNILVMTFTEAATKELRERLHSVLKDVYARLCNTAIDGENDGQPSKAVKERIKRADRLIDCSGAREDEEKKMRVKMRAELAILEFDGAAISTIHGFCQRVLKRYAFETGLGFTQEIKHNKHAELNALAEDWWRTHQDQDIALGDLKKYILKLGEKADYTLTTDDSTLKTAYKIVEQYEQGRLERENLNFDDLLRILRDTLKNEQYGRSFADKLRKEYKAALIDEFQDTDPVQYDIFKYIFLDKKHPCPLYFVGDPKQAIYEFRGGDIYTYFKAAEGLKKHTLNVNYRSTRRLMDAVNAMFHEEKPGISFGDARIEYRETRVDDDAADGEVHPLEIVRFAYDKKPSKSQCMPFIMKSMTGMILDLLEEKDSTGKNRFSPGDIAILMGAKTNMPDIQHELFKAGIPSVVRDPGNVFKSSAAAELAAFLTAVAEADSGGRDKDFRAALLSVFGGVKAEDAVAELDDPVRFAGHIDRLKDMKGIWTTWGFPALASRMEQDGYLLRTAEKTNGERMLSDIGQIMELCCAASKKAGARPENLVNWLSERISNADAESDPEEYKQELETDGDAVRIMTVHVSKGLQFPIVFLPDCWNINSPNDPRNWITLPCYHDAGGQLVFSSAEDRDAKKQTREELRLEKIRQLYVALTRAKERTILFAPAEDAKGEKKEQKEAEPLNVLLENLLKRKKDPSDPPYAEKELSAEAAENRSRPRPPLPPLCDTFEPPEYSLSPVKGSYSSLSPNNGNDEDDARDCDRDIPLFPRHTGESKHPVFAIPGGEKLGTCWHNILEKIPFDADNREIREVSEAELLEGGFLKPGALDVTVDMIGKTLDRPLQSPDGTSFTLRDIPWKDRLSEQEFNFCSVHAEKNTAALGNILRRHWGKDATKSEFIAVMKQWSRDIPKGFMTGIVDLVFRRNGFYYIIDWKSNTLDRDIDNFNDPGIRAEMARHGYFFQYMLYAAVLHCRLKAALKNDYSWERCFGGIHYYFLRGIAAGGRQPVFSDRPSEKLLDEFSAALGMEVLA